jgi:hypothetical protein
MKIKGQHIKTENDKRDVYILAISEGYAMVRRPRCMPYVCKESEVKIVDKFLKDNI